MKPDATAAILAALAELKGEVRQLRSELAEKRGMVRPREARLRRRHDDIRALARGLGLGPTWAGARAVLDVVDGVQPAPVGLQGIVARLRKDDETPTTTKTYYRILCEGGDSHDSPPVVGVDSTVARWASLQPNTGDE